jgi:hypothetical protein
MRIEDCLLNFLDVLQTHNPENFKLIFPEKELRCLSPNFHIHVSDLCIYSHDRSAYSAAQENMWTDPGNIKIALRYMHARIGTDAEQLFFWEYRNGIFGAVWPFFFHQSMDSHTIVITVYCGVDIKMAERHALLRYTSGFKLATCRTFSTHSVHNEKH